MTEQSQQRGNPPARRRLGRGLNALLGGSDAGNKLEQQQEQSNLRDIDVAKIERNPYQPRTDFDDTALAELAKSLKLHGVLQPLLVRPLGEQFQLIAGERRLLAAKKAGLETVPCRIMQLNERGTCEAALEENLKRQDLNVLEKAQAFQDYLDRFGNSIEELGRRLSMNRSTVSNYLRLLELPEQVKHALATDRISNGHARALLPLDDDDCIGLCKRIEAEQLSVRETEKEVRAIQKGETAATIPMPSPKPEPSDPSAVSNHILSIQDQLRKQLGMKIQIRVLGKENGRIIIDFQSNDDFERVTRLLRNVA